MYTALVLALGYRLPVGIARPEVPTARPRTRFSHLIMGPYRLPHLICPRNQRICVCEDFDFFIGAYQRPTKGPGHGTVQVTHEHREGLRSLPPGPERDFLTLSWGPIVYRTSYAPETKRHFFFEEYTGRGCILLWCWRWVIASQWDCDFHIVLSKKKSTDSDHCQA
jgi:hypothetical protein